MSNFDALFRQRTVPQILSYQRAIRNIRKNAKTKAQRINAIKQQTDYMNLMFNTGFECGGNEICQKSMLFDFSQLRKSDIDQIWNALNIPYSKTKSSILGNMKDVYGTLRYLDFTQDLGKNNEDNEENGYNADNEEKIAELIDLTEDDDKKQDNEDNVNIPLSREPPQDGELLELQDDIDDFLEESEEDNGNNNSINEEDIELSISMHDTESDELVLQQEPIDPITPRGNFDEEIIDQRARQSSRSRSFNFNDNNNNSNTPDPPRKRHKNSDKNEIDDDIDLNTNNYNSISDDEHVDINKGLRRSKRSNKSFKRWNPTTALQQDRERQEKIRMEKEEREKHEALEFQRGNEERRANEPYEEMPLHYTDEDGDLAQRWPWTKVGRWIPQKNTKPPVYLTVHVINGEKKFVRSTAPPK